MGGPHWIAAEQAHHKEVKLVIGDEAVVDSSRQSDEVAFVGRARVGKVKSFYKIWRQCVGQRGKRVSRCVFTSKTVYTDPLVIKIFHVEVPRTFQEVPVRRFH